MSVPYNQYKVVAEAAQGTPAHAVALNVFASNQPWVYSNRKQVFSIFDQRDDALIALRRLQAEGITVALHGRHWGYSWQPLDDSP